VKAIDRLKRDVHALSLAARDPRVPLYAKIVAVAVAAYALSPIDLIPDFIPVIGLLDDVILLPLGIALAVKLTPRHLWLARVAEAEQGADKLPRMVWGAALIVPVWLLFIALFAWWLLSLAVD
jgi:uncharacterized membrane protein YkvA (DUF1232 family)